MLQCGRDRNSEAGKVCSWACHLRKDWSKPGLSAWEWSRGLNFGALPASFWRLEPALDGFELDDLVREIGLGLPSARGRKPLSKSLEVGETRPLQVEDVVASRAGNHPLPTSTPPSLQKLRSRHHQLAQMLASGLTDTQVCLALGYSPSRISILKADPAFKELLAYYDKQHEKLHLDVQERLITLGLDSIEVLQQRLDDDPDEFSARELKEMAEMALDRTGHGKSSTVSVMHGLDEETHALLKAQHASSRQGTVLNLSDGEIIDVTGVPIPQGRQFEPDGPPEFLPQEEIGSLFQGENCLPLARRETSEFEAALYTAAEAQVREFNREGTLVPEEMDRLDQGAQLLLFPASAVRRDREE
jgi:hypothetical protein